MKLKIISLLIVTIIGLSFFVFVPKVVNYKYPIKYKQIVETYSLKYNVEKALIYSIIKVESSFKTNATSKVGAIGLMQLLPTTAKYISTKINYKKAIDLFDAECNIHLGVAYFSYLLNRFNNLEQSICAYNAGEGVVTRWIENSNEIFVIKYEETKNYLSKILFAYKVYQNKLG